MNQATKFLEEQIATLFESDEKLDNERGQKASYYLSQARKHLHEFELYLSAITDPSTPNDIGTPEDIKMIRDINVHGGEVEAIKKKLKSIKK